MVFAGKWNQCSLAFHRLHGGVPRWPPVWDKIYLSVSMLVELDFKAIFKEVILLRQIR